MSLKFHLARIHRWTALILAPFFLVLCASGAVLAVKPILATPEPVAVSPDRLAAALRTIDPQGSVRSLAGSDGGRSIVLAAGRGQGRGRGYGQGAGQGRGRGTEPAGTYALATGERIAPVPAFDVFAFAKRLHVGLLVEAGLPVQIATWGMVLVILTALPLGLPVRLRNLRAWHLASGWLTLPLILALPLSGGLIALHLTGGTAIDLPPPGRPVAVAAALERAGAAMPDLRIAEARRFRRGNVLIAGETSAGPVTLAVGEDRILPLAGNKGWISQIHEGTWAGAWSGALNLAGSLVLTFLTGSGIVLWLRRRAVRKRRRA